MENEKKLLDILEPYKKHILGAEIYGTTVIPYIKNPTDYDVVVVFENEQAENDFKDFLFIHNEGEKTNFILLKEQFNFCIHATTLEKQNKSVSHNYIYAYQIKFRKPLTGYEMILPDFDYFDRKDDVKKELINFVERMNGYVIPKEKYWYNIYTNKCICDNNSYDLTEEQIENINLLHDCIDCEKRDELIEECKEWLKTC